MLRRLQRQQTPTLAAMLEDLGHPPAALLARSLGVTKRTANRWIAADQAPRPAMLALFWLTRWGRSEVHCEAVNQAAFHASLSRALQREVDTLRRELARVVSIGEFGAANAPAFRAETPAQRLRARSP